ncbi:glycosyltransferase [Vibrio chaetopteri]|uniref:glycosyltransferase n=1 Tax=Vibrio chaetopteri TaxID=3016528 RepID=UPI003AB230FD
MKVSIIAVCYNCAATIEGTIKSVVSQTCQDIEYIVVDCGSTDEINQIVSTYSGVVDVHIGEPDAGLYDAMNKGIQLVTDDVRGILNSDDFFCTEQSNAELMSGFVSENTDGVYSDLLYVQENNSDKTSRLYSSEVYKPSLIKLGLSLLHPSFYVKRKAYKQCGMYKKACQVAADFEFIARGASKGIRLNRVPKITVEKREGGIRSSGLMWRILQNTERVQACRENGVYTNIAMAALKLPYKLLTLLSRKLSSV